MFGWSLVAGFVSWFTVGFAGLLVLVSGDCSGEEFFVVGCCELCFGLLILCWLLVY